VSGILIAPPTEIRLAHTKAVFLQCYPLNRFLGLLILRVLDPAVRMPDTRITGFQGMHGHTCSRDPEACHGLPHAVRYVKDGVPGEATFDIVVLRHGLKGPRASFNTEHKRARQILPDFAD
jgi:hypothetical protein